MRRLEPGDTVALVTPAGPVPVEVLDRAAAALAAWGLVVRRPRTPGTGVPPYLADGDESRAADFQAAWLDPAVAAVIAARGGYGTQRMLDLVDWSALRVAGPKPFAGSSDITALHQAIATHLGWPTLFSPMPAGTFWDDEASEGLRRMLFGPAAPVVLPAAEALSPGIARGPLTGGNLSLLAAGLGTPEQRGATGAIVLLEDVEEQPYRLDRMLTQLLRAGWFDGVAGIALGSWTGCGEPEAVRAVMLDRLCPLGVPILWDLRFGHLPGAATLPLGGEAVLDATTLHLTVTSR
ncbi:LD-carboxypeptidase [Amycolatopsis rhizosphaerae]|uniref:LD-carboxypeptidase n=1 Tax=Amycolatopsis rhizosphaerae TaxID=2053003 RepID=A0A558B0F0_9PSEU|nr:LD-carboxypeptidase [Amycolatopsis rhizosphaerae]TVT30005.1 LD-carboxypeptidase [Amycolatopsis rhizosphaerae]